jgi:hypothetical protein
MRLHQALDGATGVQPPFEWIVSRVCEEFDCLPSQAMRELELGDADLVFDILDLRAYARTKEMVDHAKSPGDVKVTPLVQDVFDIQQELMRLGGPVIR